MNKPPVTAVLRVLSLIGLAATAAACTPLETYDDSGGSYGQGPREVVVRYESHGYPDYYYGPGYYGPGYYNPGWYGGFYYGGPAYGGGGLGLILLICLIVYLFGGFRTKS